MKEIKYPFLKYLLVEHMVKQTNKQEKLKTNFLASELCS